MFSCARSRPLASKSYLFKKNPKRCTTLLPLELHFLPSCRLIRLFARIMRNSSPNLWQKQWQSPASTALGGALSQDAQISGTPPAQFCNAWCWICSRGGFPGVAQLGEQCRTLLLSAGFCSALRIHPWQRAHSLRSPECRLQIVLHGSQEAECRCLRGLIHPKPAPHGAPQWRRLLLLQIHGRYGQQLPRSASRADVQPIAIRHL